MHDKLKTILPLPLLIVFFLSFAPPAQQAHAGEPIRQPVTKSLNPKRSDVPVYGYRIVNTYPHDPGAFTQGLIFHNGFLYEGTGLHGASSLRKVELETGRVLKRHDLPEKYFGEGVALCSNRLIQLTYQSRIGFIYDLDLRQTGSFTYPTEGWGLTCDGDNLILSDGTAILRRLDAKTFKVVKQITVTDRGRPVFNLNELEFVKGEIFANVWKTDAIARISPDTGQVTGWIDLGGLSQLAQEAGTAIDCLNGIAYDERADRLFVTGKLWPKLFEIRLIPD
ncbi:MAG: glutamine cyclotransferase [Syntrophus sp. (in: bacteria)]|nr:glutamine cyclotransferase [Syntrophus sp. (in: bacteria)]